MTIKATKNTLYYISFFIFIFSGVLSNSMLGQIKLFDIVSRYGLRFSVVLAVIKLLMTKATNLKDFLIWMSGILISSIVAVGTGSTIPFFIIIMLIAASKCSPEVLMKLYIYVAGGIVLLSFLFSQIGIIEDRLFYHARSSGISVRHSFGMTYVTIFSAYIFFLSTTYLYHKRNQVKWYDYLLVLILSYLTYEYTDARLEMLMTILLLVVFFFRRRINEWNILRRICVYVFPLSAGISGIIQYIYMKNPSRWTIIDSLLSHRLRLSSTVINDYGFTLFGQYIRMQGNGTINFDKSYGYYFVDNFYLHYALRYGLIFMIVLCIVFPIVFKRINDSNMSLLLILLSIACIHGIIISSIMLAYFNPLFVIGYAQYTNKGTTSELTQKSRLGKHRIIMRFTRK